MLFQLKSPALICTLLINCEKNLNIIKKEVIIWKPTDFERQFKQDLNVIRNFQNEIYLYEIIYEEVDGCNS